MKKTLVIFAGVVIVLLGGGAWLISGSAPRGSGKNYDQFAQCIASRKLTMYGADWCTHCQAEKARFNGSFKYVPYIECPNNPQLCLEKGVTGYPTWIDASGRKYEGEQGLAKLAQISSCVLP